MDDMTMVPKLRFQYLSKLLGWLETDSYPFPDLIYEEIERRADDGEFEFSADDMRDLRAMYGHSMEVN